MLIVRSKLLIRSRSGLGFAGARAAAAKKTSGFVNKTNNNNNNNNARQGLCLHTTTNSIVCARDKVRHSSRGSSSSSSSSSRTVLAKAEVKMASAPIIHVDTTQYDSQLLAKVERVKTQFRDYYTDELEVYKSKKKHYRMRSEFRIWRDDGEIYYVMFKGGGRDAEKIRVDDFHVGSELVNELMRKVIEGVRKSKVLEKKIFQANFHTTLSGQAMVSLLYHRKLDEEWKAEAEKLRESLAAAEGVEKGHVPSIIGRSRKQKVVLGHDYVVETLPINGTDLMYQQLEGGFSQPNGGMCIHMLEWACKHTKESNSSDLLELYCGNGNFSIAMASNFRKCVGTELAKTSVAAAKYNIEANKVKNVFIARCSSEDFSSAWLNNNKTFKRFQQQGLKLEDCDFQTVLVDPPRAGLDDDTVKLVSKFERIVYISCNPDTLFNNVEAIGQTHKVVRMALFDQFPYSHHTEIGCVLQRETPQAVEEATDSNPIKKQKKEE